MLGRLDEPLVPFIMFQSLPRSLDAFPQTFTDVGHAAVALASVMPRNIANAHVVADINAAAPSRLVGAEWVGLDVVGDMLRDFCLSTGDDDQLGFPDATFSLKVAIERKRSF